MFEELENRGKSEHLSDSAISDIRVEYGFEYDASAMLEDYIEENETETVEKYEESYEDVVYTEVDGDVADGAEELLFEDEQCLTEDVGESSTKKTKADPGDYHYQCHICHKTFDQMCFLSNHTRDAHQCLPKVNCTCGCERTLSTWESLMAHRRKNTEGEKIFSCQICDQKFSTKTGLKIHIKFKHERPAKNNECPECGRTFKDSSVLKAHIRTHLPDEEKFAYECEICGKKVVNKWSLKYHIETIHERIQKHFCHLCDKGFGNKSNLRSHLISHSTENVSCDICGGIFKNRISLQSHKKMHKPESARNFSCSLCTKTFHNRNHLSRHMVAHSEQRQHKCPFDGCLSVYKWPKDLKNHMKTVHEGLFIKINPRFD